MFNDTKHLTKILMAKYLRYKVLTRQEAQWNGGAPPRIISERVSLEKQLSVLDRQLREAGLTAEQVHEIASGRSQTPVQRQKTASALDRAVIIHLPKHIPRNLPERIFNCITDRVSNLLKVPPTSLEIKMVYPESAILAVNTSVDATLELSLQLMTNQEALHLIRISDDAAGQTFDFTIDKIVVTTVDDHREGWLVIDNVFRLVSVHRAATETFIARQLERARRQVVRAQQNRQYVLNLAGLGLTDIPAELWDLTQLRSLSLTRNNLVRLPDEIGQLTSLTNLNLSHNQLMTLPHTLTNCRNLQAINLTGNLVKEMPNELGNLAENAKFQYDPYFTPNGS